MKNSQNRKSLENTFKFILIYTDAPFYTQLMAAQNFRQHLADSRHQKHEYFP